MSATQLSFTGAGSKFDLLAQLADIGRVDRTAAYRLNIVKVTNGDTVDELKANIGVHIFGVIALDDFGNDWVITGRIPLHVLLEHEKVGFHFYEGPHFWGLANTRRHKGFITPGMLPLPNGVTLRS